MPGSGARRAVRAAASCIAALLLATPAGAAVRGESTVSPVTRPPDHAPPATPSGPKARYTRPPYLGQSFPELRYQGFVLIGNPHRVPGDAGNDAFFARVKEALDLIARKSPFLFSMMRAVNPGGRRVVFYTGRIGPASFNAWNGDYIVRIMATHLDERPVFDNNPYYLAATLVHELIGHGRQESDGRLWALYDWCGNDPALLPGVIVRLNRHGVSSGLVEYEANLYARWFLESVQNDYPNYIERVIKRTMRIARLLGRRFPRWYDDDKPAWVLLGEFENHFAELCPGVPFTPHASPPN